MSAHTTTWCETYATTTITSGNMAPGAGEGARHDGGCQNGCVKVVVGIHYLRYNFNSANQQDISHCLVLSIVQSSENRNLVSFLFVSSGPEPGKLGVEFSSSPSPSSACSSYTCSAVVHRVRVASLGGKSTQTSIIVQRQFGTILSH